MRYEIDQAVLSAVHDERVYQNRKWGTIAEHPHEVGGYLTLIRKLSADADTAWSTSRGDIGALDEIRKIIAVGIACLEQHGPVARSPMAFIALQGRNAPHDPAFTPESAEADISKNEAQALKSLLTAWLIEAPGLRYLAPRKLGNSYSFHWTLDHNTALKFSSEELADLTMMAIRASEPELFAFSLTLGDAKAVEHGWLTDPRPKSGGRPAPMQPPVKTTDQCESLP